MESIDPKGQRIFVADAMSGNVITAKPDSLVLDAAKNMVNHDIGAIVVTDSDMLPLGIITEGDIVRALVKKEIDIESTTVKDVMTTPVITITDDIELSFAARLMASRHIKKLCIVDLQGRLIGILTEGDVIKHAGYLIKLFR